jgi:dihydrofolate reductase
LKVVERAGEDYGFAEFFRTIDTLIVGRKTYDTVLGFAPWPWADKAVAVVSHRPEKPRHNERFVSGTPAEILAQLPDSRCAYVDGGAVIQQFLAAGLVDELTVSTIPTVLGSGVPLFGQSPTRRFALVRSTAFPSGLVQSTWRPA